MVNDPGFKQLGSTIFLKHPVFQLLILYLWPREGKQSGLPSPSSVYYSEAGITVHDPCNTTVEAWTTDKPSECVNWTGWQFVWISISTRSVYWYVNCMIVLSLLTKLLWVFKLWRVQSSDACIDTRYLFAYTLSSGQNKGIVNGSYHVLHSTDV